MPQLVGIGIDHGLLLGQTSLVTATAGSSQQALAIAGGFSAVPSNQPPVIEPVFGQAQDLIPLVLASPASGVTVSASLSVPNVPALTGYGAWVQAFQLDAPMVRASSLVGGPIH